MNPMLDKWIIVFTNGLKIRWWHRFFKKDFRHCFAFGYDPINSVWIYCDFANYRLTVFPITTDQATNIIVYIKQFARHLVVTVDREAKYFPLAPFYCVPMCRQLIGLKTISWTPYGLYCALKKTGVSSYFGNVTEEKDYVSSR
jgi:hypothetical protein